MIVALIILSGLFVAFVAKDELLEAVTEAVLSRVVGAKLTMHKFYLSMALGRLDIEGLKIQNPPGFSDDTLLDLPKIAVKFDRIALATGRLNISRADIYLKELLFEKNKQGKMNVDALKIMSGPAPAMHVDLLNLKIVLVVEKDCRGKKPVVKGHYLNLDKSYRNINGFNDLITLLVVESLKNAGIRGAKVLGLSVLLGGPVTIPIAIVINDIGRGRVQHDIATDAGSLYALSLKVLDELGTVTREQRSAYQITARVQGAGVSLKLKPESENLTGITIVAKKFFLPHDEISGGILYEITQRVKTVEKRNVDVNKHHSAKK